MFEEQGANAEVVVSVGDREPDVGGPGRLDDLVFGQPEQVPGCLGDQNEMTGLGPATAAVGGLPCGGAGDREEPEAQILGRHLIEHAQYLSVVAGLCRPYPYGRAVGQQRVHRPCGDLVVGHLETHFRQSTQAASAAREPRPRGRPGQGQGPFGPMGQNPAPGTAPCRRQGRPSPAGAGSALPLRAGQWKRPP